VRAIFLDRDGVINEAVIRNGKPYPPASTDNVKLVANAAELLQQLKEYGFLLIVVTNQPDVRRGTSSQQIVEQIHATLAKQLPIDDFFVCYHDDQDRCECRKPSPGLLYKAARKYGIKVEQSFLIGDRWRDIEAGAAAGCRTVLIDHGYHERSPVHPPDKTVSSLAQAVNWIVIQEVTSY
jgi:D-glycero-D-manno-heptose 1,7-bisphosphate phosphatase